MSEYRDLFLDMHPALCRSWKNAPKEIKLNALIHYYYIFFKDFDLAQKQAEEFLSHDTPT